MENNNTALIDLAINFIENHWNEIDLKKVDITEGKENFVETIKKDYFTLCWLISEVMHWGCKTNYLKQYVVDCDIALVIKVDNSYFKLNEDYLFKPVEPKTKTVLYFE